MDETAIIRYVTDTFTGVEAFIVIKEYPGFDTASDLDLPGVFRLNIGVGKDTFRALFGQQQNPADAASYDFTALDHLMPHPVYSPQAWVSILNPSDATFQTEVQFLLAEASAIAVK